MDNPRLWKFLRTGLRSQSRNMLWNINQWEKIDKPLSMCRLGFHASALPTQALSYIKGEIIAQVEVRGNSVKQEDKQVWSEMRILRAYYWKKEDSIALAIFTANLVLHIFEEKYPNDDRPRKAIKAAKVYLENPSIKNRDAAAADAAYDAAHAAAHAANAAWAANAAANTVAYAAWAAADAANAAWAANAAVNTVAYAAKAAGQQILQQINDWMINHVATLEEIK